jgi:hypothetical protein
MQQKKRLRKKTKIEADKSDKCVIHRTVDEFQVTGSQCPALKVLLPVLRNKVNFQGNTRALRHVRKLGFRWKKSMDN